MLPLWQQSLIRSLFHYSAERLTIERAFLVKHEHVPSRLYKYRQFVPRHRDALEADQLWLSSPDQFNDPFDTAIYFHPGRIEMEDLSVEEFIREMKTMTEKVEAGEEYDMPPVRNAIRKEDWIQKVSAPLIEQAPVDMRPKLGEAVEHILRLQDEAAVRRMSDQLRRGFGVLSLSMNPSSILMWSHYSDCHRGFCIEYDLAALPYGDLRRRLCFPVFYRGKRTDASRYLSKGPRDFNNLFGEYLCLLKSDEWSYEREWRIIYPGGPQEANRPIAMPEPTALILGASVSQADREWAEAFCKERAISMRVARQSLDSFRIEIADA